ncbi:MAG: vWA domain-containing protein [Microthrixaceae bacterium]
MQDTRYPARGRRARWIATALALIVAFSAAGAITPSGSSADPASDGNPDLPQRCGLDMTLIVDRSGSIRDQNTTVAAAGNALIEGLAGTGSNVQVISFSTSATALEDANGDGDTDDIADLRFQPADDVVVPVFPSRGYTNWDDALEMARRSPEGIAPLTVILTDGNPTAFNFDTPNGHGGLVGSGTDPLTKTLALNAAITEAAQLKAIGTHILAVGVGNSVNAGRLSMISGDEQITSGGPVSFAEGDWTLVGFDELKSLLEEFARDLCAPSVNITKTEIAFDGTTRPGDGWRFDLELGAPPEIWSSPEQPAENTTASLNTLEGKANFKWENRDAAPTPAATITEQARPGWVFESVSCFRRDYSTNQTTELDIQTQDGPNGSSLWELPGGIGPSDSINCAVVNRQTDPNATTTTQPPTTTTTTTTTTEPPTTTTTTSTTTTTTTEPPTTTTTTTTTEPPTSSTSTSTTSTSMPDSSSSTTSSTTAPQDTTTSTVPPASVQDATTSSTPPANQQAASSPPSSPGQSLAVTGVSAAAAALVGLAVLMLGLGLLGASRRRERPT